MDRVLNREIKYHACKQGNVTDRTLFINAYLLKLKQTWWFPRLYITYRHLEVIWINHLTLWTNVTESVSQLNRYRCIGLFHFEKAFEEGLIC